LGNWLTVLIIAVVLMAFALALLPHIEHALKRSKSGRSGKQKSGSGATGRGVKSAGPVNYALAPKMPDVMAGALFELLSMKLSFKEINAFADLIVSPEMIERYIDHLSARSSLTQFAKKVAFLSKSMEVNRFTDGDRARVANALRHKASKEYKLLEIQRNLDDIL
jgi:hypothetical protein